MNYQYIKNNSKDIGVMTCTNINGIFPEGNASKCLEVEFSFLHARCIIIFIKYLPNFYKISQSVWKLLQAQHFDINVVNIEITWNGRKWRLSFSYAIHGVDLRYIPTKYCKISDGTLKLFRALSVSGKILVAITKKVKKQELPTLDVRISWLRNLIYISSKRILKYV